jgi:hypothetical protein
MLGKTLGQFPGQSPCLFLFAAVLAAQLVASLPAGASSLPKADLTTHSISLGTAPSLATEFALSPDLSLGASMALPFYGSFSFVRYDIHGGYVLVHQGPLSVRGMVGFFGDIATIQRSDQKLSPIGFEAGLAFSYRFFSWFTGRINIAAGISFPQSSGLGLFPPLGGLELAFQPYQHFEASVGFNGNGDILALRYLF